MKIGHSGQLDRRFSQIQKQHPERDLILTTWFRGGLEHERALHQRFADGALGHEWFRWDTPGLSEFVSNADQFESFYWPDPDEGFPGDQMPDGSVSPFSRCILDFYTEVAA